MRRAKAVSTRQQAAVAKEPIHSTGAAPAAVIRDAVSAAHSTGFRRGQEQRFTLISIGSFGAGF